jgi:hypothetical protein
LPFFISMTCVNLIPGMALWKQNLLTCAPAIVFPSEIFNLWKYALREMMVAMQGKRFENHFHSLSLCIWGQEWQ